jgi:hypothetical protein
MIRTQSPHERFENMLFDSLDQFFHHMGIDISDIKYIPSYGAGESNKGEMHIDVFIQDPNEGENLLNKIILNFKKLDDGKSR